MRLIIQIPCLNEESTLPETLAELPQHIEGIDEIKVLIIDDGSTDNTAQVARDCGVDYIISHTSNRGLAVAFQTGLDACLERGADIIVNTDADNQYPGRYIADLVRPILNQEADMVIGDRQTHTIPHFSRVKKMLQYFGSAVVRRVSNTDVVDAPSGFRALSRNTALRLNIITTYTYTLETIIQAGKKNLTVVSVPIETNPKTRESRLIKNIPSYVLRSATTILRLFVLYEPLKTFFYLSFPFLLVGGGLWLRYIFLAMSDEVGRGAHVQSVIVGAALLIIGFLVFLIGILGELIAINRHLHEETLFRLKKSALENYHHQQKMPDDESLEL